MGEWKRFRNSTSSRVENQLKTIELRARKVEKEVVAIVYLGMNEICSDSFNNLQRSQAELTLWRHFRLKLTASYLRNSA